MERIDINDGFEKYWIVRYYDENMNGTSKENAKRIHIDKYDKNDRFIETVMMVSDDNEPEEEIETIKDDDVKKTI